YNGLNDEEELSFGPYQSFISAVQAKVNSTVLDSIRRDVAHDDYHYFRGSDYDAMQASILRRYKYINNPQGNSPDTSSRTERYDTSYKTTPDVEDINQDYTLNEYEKYYQYHLSIRPADLVVGRNHIVDKREVMPSLRNGKKDEVETWYQFRIPLSEYERREGAISDFTSIRFMRMFLTGFRHPVVLRFANLDLVRGEWRVYEQNLDNSVPQSGTLTMSAVNVEENGDKVPVNYVLPPGIERSLDPTQPQLVESNEQALSLVVKNLGAGEAKAVYKNTALDLRQYRRLQMFVHANAMEQNTTGLSNDELAVFVRLGSDYKNNYYEYEIPLKLTPPGKYSIRSAASSRQVWPEDNMLDIPLRVFTKLKKARNVAKNEGRASYNHVFSAFDDSHPGNQMSIMGNPTLGEVKTMIIGVRNKSSQVKSGEVWVNELRLRDYNNKGGWAAQGNLNMQLSDFGQLNVQGRYMTNGFGGLEQGVNERSTDDYKTYSVTTSLELGKFFPDKAKVSAPLYYSVTKEELRPKYNPLDNDMELKEALDAIRTPNERDSLERIAVTKTTNTNFALSNVRVGIQTKRHPMPYDPANFSLSYSHSHRYTSGKTTVYEREDNWKGALSYSWTPVYRPLELFRGIRNRSKWLDIVRQFGFNWLPQNIAFNSDINRNYYELQERDMENTTGTKLPLTFNSQFQWNRDLSLRWDLTRNLHLNYHSATHAEIEQPYTPVNKDLYPDRYQAWKDSVWTSILHLGTPLDYAQRFSLSYQLPLNLIPIFDWINADANYNATYNWVRGTNLDDGTSLGNTISINRDLNINGSFSFERLYNHIPFLRKANERFSRLVSSNNRKRAPKNRNRDMLDSTLPRNQRSFEREITLRPDTAIDVLHNKHTRRITVLARTEDGKTFKLRFRKLNDNTLHIINKVDSVIKLKLTVTPKEPLETKHWYRTAQTLARVLMLVRDVSGYY
ncbi:MAG: cell surface protein SprA, partial [Prevotella pleuritidis]|nr:cell surface protein SprA [Hoylesella pleuritidis]